MLDGNRLNTRQHIVEKATMICPTWNSIPGLTEDSASVLRNDTEMATLDFSQDIPSVSHSWPDHNTSIHPLIVGAGVKEEKDLP